MSLLAAIALVYFAATTYRLDKRAAEREHNAELREQRAEERFRQEWVRENRESFLDLLYRTEELLCPSCVSGGCSSPREPNYSIKVYLDNAARLETEIPGGVTAAEYLLLAGLGSTVWDFAKTEKYCDKALNTAETDLDRHSCYLILAHIHFENHKDDVGAAIADARRFFQKAVAELSSNSESRRNRFFLGNAYSLWAQDEQFYGSADQVEDKKLRATGHWKPLARSDDLEREMEHRIENAKRGIAPRLPCPSVALPQQREEAAPAPRVDWNMLGGPDEKWPQPAATGVPPAPPSPE